MSNLEELFEQSNAALFQDIQDVEVISFIATRQAFMASLIKADEPQDYFDRLLIALEHSLNTSDDLMAMSLISKINSSLVSITNSLTSILNLFKVDK